MHCPKCGIESDVEQKFCRKCGFNLEPVGKLMLPGDDHSDEIKLEKAERDRVLLRRMVSWMTWGMLIMLIGIVALVTKKQLQLDKLVGLIGSLVALAGVSVATYGLLDAMRGGCFKKSQPNIIKASSTGEIERASTTKELEGRVAIPIGSVTERTTQLIGIDSEQHS